MKFLLVFCLLAVAAADEDKTQDKKTQQLDTTQNTSTLTQPTASLLNSQVFPPTTFFSTADPGLQVSNLAYTGYTGNVSPIQTVNPDFFTTAAQGAIPAFPVTRTVLQPAGPVVNGIQSAFPGNVFPAGVASTVGAIPAQFPAVGILSSGVQGVAAGNPNTPANTIIQNVPAGAYRFVEPQGYSGLQAQGLQTAQQVGLAAIPAFTSGILPAIGNLQGQNIPAGLQQILSNPAAGNAVGNVPGLATGNISGPLSNVFRQG